MASPNPNFIPQIQIGDEPPRPATIKEIKSAIAEVGRDIRRRQKPPNPPGSRRGINVDCIRPYMLKKGQVGNPEGRPPSSKKPLREAYLKLAATVERTTGLTLAELVAAAMYDEAINNHNVMAAREIRETVEGRLTESTITPGQNDDQAISAKLYQKLFQNGKELNNATVRTTTTVTVERQIEENPNKQLSDNSTIIEAADVSTQMVLSKRPVTSLEAREGVACS